MTTYEKRARVFLEKDIPAHIIDKNGIWYNGFLDEVSTEFLIIIDRVLGKVPVFFQDIEKFDFFIGDFSTLERRKEK